ncbi:unnamed protein product [Spirodela intermedia]|uniref:Uncharacterized protein n=1 Tax=Spirodela intermedia TaxID=51605 RepID=A0A7I8J6A7_SPIIN|nr:unnamed protein product [Spirodela intermedia]CAA6665787.1 unnamed protein product [Spirodela intermedia]
MKSGDITIGRKLSPEDYEFGYPYATSKTQEPGGGVIRSLLTQAGGASEAVVNRREEKEHETGKCPFPGLAQGPPRKRSEHGTSRNRPIFPAMIPIETAYDARQEERCMPIPVR